MAPDSDPAPPPEPVSGSDHADRAPGELDRALELIRFLRAECPWDAEQTHASLVPHLLEEAHEVAEAIHAGDDRALEGELGDLLLNLAFQVVVGEEAGRFTADSVTRRIEEKMRRRHPHLYGLGPREEWEALKAREREEWAEREAGEREDAGRASGATAPGGVLSGIPAGLDALTKAHRIQDRVAGVGFDWEDWRGALEKVREETGEVAEELERTTAGDVPAERLEEELGDLLFAVVNVVRLAGSHPVRALERANRKFTGRFEGVERLAVERGVRFGEATLAELDELWEAVKGEEAVRGEDRKEADRGMDTPGDTG